MNDIFNNREIAIIIWSILGCIWVLRESTVRKSIIALIKIFFGYKFFVTYLLSVCYTIVGIYILYRFDFWTIKLLKATILWCVFTIISIIVNVNKIREDKKYFSNAVIENFKFSAIIGFITGLYTFGLFTEIVFVPIATLFTLMVVFTEKQPANRSVHKFSNAVLLIGGICIIGFTIKKLITNTSEFTSFDTVRDFLFPILLAIWFLPFIYLLSIYMIYENGFVTMENVIKESALIRFAKVNSLFRFNFDVKGFDRWRSQIFLNSVTTKQEIKKSIHEIKRLQIIEKNPPNVIIERGWSPYKAKDFLISENIETSYYKQTYENDWSASSDYIKLDDTHSTNHLSYYVEGNDTIAKSLHLVLNINSTDPANRVTATYRFLKCASVLYQKALSKELESKIQNALLKAKDIRLNSGYISVILKHEIWDDGVRYSVHFYIKNQRSNTKTI